MRPKRIKRIVTNIKKKYPAIHKDEINGIIETFKDEKSRNFLIEYDKFESLYYLRNNLFKNFLTEDALLFMLDMMFRWDAENRPKSTIANIRNSPTYLHKIAKYKNEISIDEVRNLIENFPYKITIKNGYDSQKTIDTMTKTLSIFPTFDKMQKCFNNIVNYKLNWLKPNYKNNISVMMFVVYYFSSPMYQIDTQSRYDYLKEMFVHCRKNRDNHINKFLLSCRDMLKEFNLMGWIDTFIQFDGSGDESQFGYYDINDILAVINRKQSKIYDHSKSYELAKSNPYNYFQFLNIINEKSYMFTDLWTTINNMINENNASMWFDVLFDPKYYTTDWNYLIRKRKEFAKEYNENYHPYDYCDDARWGLFDTYNTQMKYLKMSKENNNAS